MRYVLTLHLYLLSVSYWVINSDLIEHVIIFNYGGVGGGVMTTFGDLGIYVKGFTCSPHEI